jgi:4-hydroxy-3-polyprenylbenzoate decarboxylase
VYGYETGGFKEMPYNLQADGAKKNNCADKFPICKVSTADESIFNGEVSNAGKKLHGNEAETASESSLRKDISRWINNGANFRVYGNADLFAPIASGSFPVDGMVIMPCSMSTAAKIATGIGDSLLCRAAACCIKEKTPLVIVPRESPLSSIHLQNLLTLSQNGVYIMPPVPAFYDRVTDFEAMTDAIVGRVLKTAGVTNNLYTQWS